MKPLKLTEKITLGKRITFRLTEKERTFFEKLAKKKKTTISNLIRAILGAYIN